MKKLVCMLLAMMLLLAAGMALAETETVTISNPVYENGVLTLEVGGLKSYAEVWVDGSSTGVSVKGEGTVSVKLSLTPGTHTVLLYNPVLEKSPSKTFEVNKAKTPRISGSYTEVGKLVVSVSNLNGPSEIWLDGSATSRSVMADGDVVISVNLTEGAHTLLLYDAMNDLRVTASVKVDHIAKIIPGVEATCTEKGKTEGKVCAICGKVMEEQKEVPALGHKPEKVAGKEATCTEEGLTEGEKCSVCGEILKEQEKIEKLPHTPETIPGKEATCTEEGLSEGEKCTVCGEILKEQEKVPALGHSYVETNRTIAKVFYTCERCGDTYWETNRDTRNNLGKIVKDANGVDVDYTAAPSKADEKALVIAADLTSKQDLTSELGLYLNEKLLKQLKAEGYTTVNFINGDASIVIALDNVPAAECAVYSTDPAAEGGILVKVETMVKDEKTPVDAFSGVTLKRADGDVEVTENGVY